MYTSYLSGNDCGRAAESDKAQIETHTTATHPQKPSPQTFYEKRKEEIQCCPSLTKIDLTNKYCKIELSNDTFVQELCSMEKSYRGYRSQDFEVPRTLAFLGQMTQISSCGLLVTRNKN
jgi:hypothetical protein